MSALINLGWHRQLAHVGVGTLLATMTVVTHSDGASSSADNSSRTSAEDTESCVRLFVGNLVPSITNHALTTLLSKFGTVGAVDRNDERSFAHVTFDGAVERCVTSINKTRWLGTELRVEKASEHFMTRLKREWAEQNTPVQNDGDAERDVVLPSFSWRGKRTVFDDGNEATFASRGVDASNVTAPKKTEARPKAPRASDVTLELFGLAPAATGDDANEASNDGKLSLRNDASRPPSKVARGATARVTLVDDTAEMMAIGDDPSKIDVKSEHARAVAVMDLVLRTESSNMGTTLSVPRRKSLYKKLMMAGETDDDELGFTENLPSMTSVASGECIRRKGLYKMLLQQSS